MIRRLLSNWTLPLTVALAAAGCHPTQPVYFFDDGDMSHYLDVATEIEYPDVDQMPIDEVTASEEPLTVLRPEVREFWDLSLEEAIRLTLENSKVMRDLGARVQSSAPELISRNVINDNNLKTIYDPALVESGVANVIGSQLSGNGVESALAEFDAQMQANVFWEKNDQPRNTLSGGIISAFQVPVFDQDLGRFTAEIAKTSASGGTFAFRNNTFYDANNNPSRALRSDWITNFEAEFSQPLLQGAGAQYNRIAGPQSFNQFAGGINVVDGVLIARARVDLTLADFEAGVQGLVQSAENAYWDLYFAYRNLETRKVGRDSALETWKRVHALAGTGSKGGEAEKEAQARSQYYFFRAEVETALTELYRAENRLRYTMGLMVADGRLVRPSDEPTSAHITFDWSQIHAEAIVRRVDIRKQRWEVKKRELELIAARNHLLPRLDAVGRYRWLGLGDDLIDTPRSGLPPLSPGSSAFESLTGGDFQEWQLGLQLSVPIGFRRALSQVRHHQLLIARDRALLEDLELEASHQLADAVRDLDLHYSTSQSNFNRLVASEKEVRAVEAAYEANTVTLDLLLDAQRRRADAETAYYRSLVDYTRAVAQLHDRKGSLLEYNGVHLAEGPWPAKAYFDALRQARRRDAGTFVNYGFTRPSVMSRGPYRQHQQVDPGASQTPHEAAASPEDQAPTPADDVPAEPIEAEPMPDDASGQSTPPGDSAAAPSEMSADANGPDLLPASGPELRSSTGHVAHAHQFSKRRTPRTAAESTATRGQGEPVVPREPPSTKQTTAAQATPLPWNSPARPRFHKPAGAALRR